MNTATNQWETILHAYDPIYQADNGMVYRKGLLHHENLSPEERFLWAALMSRILGVSEMSLYQRNRGVLEPELFEIHSRMLETIIQTPGGIEYWKWAAPGFSADFQAHVESLLANPSAYAIQLREVRDM